MGQIIVASTNPVKVNAALAGFAQMFPKVSWVAQGIAVPSGVSAQPLGDDETLRGALNRAKGANAHLSPQGIGYSIGIEGGCTLEPNGALSVFAWIVVLDNAGRQGKSKTAMFYAPRVVAEWVQKGKELGEADDIVFGRVNSKQSNGSVGLLTKDVLTRESYYTHAVILALIPFLNSGFSDWGDEPHSP